MLSVAPATCCIVSIVWKPNSSLRVDKEPLSASVEQHNRDGIDREAKILNVTFFAQAVFDELVARHLGAEFISGLFFLSVVLGSSTTFFFPFCLRCTLAWAQVSQK